MTRLPQPGGDSGNWGTILNEYLSQSLKGDGTIKDNAVTASALAPNSVTNTAIAADSINTTSIADGSVTEALLATAVQTKLNAPAAITDGSITKSKLANDVLPSYPNSSGSATITPRPGSIDIRDYIISGSTFNLAAVIAAMEAMNGYCYIPAGNRTPSTFNIPLDSAISDNTGTAKSRFTYKFVGAGKSSRILLPSGMNSGDYLFVANSTNTNDYMAHPKMIFEDFAVSGPSSPNGSFLKTNQRSFTAKRTYFSSLLNGFYATGYCDLIRLEQVYAEAMTAGGWVYTGNDNGDGLVVEQLFAYACGGINLSGCLGASIRNCISGWHQFKASDVILEGNHWEGDGTTNATPVVTIKGSTVHVKSGFYQAKKYRPTFSIDDTGDVISDVIFEEGVHFAQRVDDPASALGAAKNVDIDIMYMSRQSELTFHSPKVHLFGQSTSLGGGGSRAVLVGLSVTASGMSAIQAILTQIPARAVSTVTFRYSTNGWEITTTKPNQVSHSTKAIPSTFLSGSATTSTSYTTDSPSGTYYYRAWIKDATLRNASASSEVSVTTNASTPLVSLVFNGYDAPAQLRLVRGTSSGTYTHWAQIVITKETQTIIDQGSYIAGAQWQNWSGSPAYITSGGFGETRRGSFFLDTNNSVIYAASAPTSGNWIVGDICWNTTPAAGGIPGWTCVTAGYPGTWKAMANIAA